MGFEEKREKLYPNKWLFQDFYGLLNHDKNNSSSLKMLKMARGRQILCLGSL